MFSVTTGCGVRGGPCRIVLWGSLISGGECSGDLTTLLHLHHQTRTAIRSPTVHLRTFGPVDQAAGLIGWSLRFNWLSKPCMADGSNRVFYLRGVNLSNPECARQEFLKRRRKCSETKHRPNNAPPGAEWASLREPFCLTEAISSSRTSHQHLLTRHRMGNYERDDAV